MKCPKNVKDFCGARECDERIYGQSLRPRSEITKAWGIILQVCFGDFRNKEIFNIAP